VKVPEYYMLLHPDIYEWLLKEYTDIVTKWDRGGLWRLWLRVRYHVNAALVEALRDELERNRS
jgi:hypothetical protein